MLRPVPGPHALPLLKIGAANRVAKTREINRHESAVETLRIVLQLEHAHGQPRGPVETVCCRKIEAAHEPLLAVGADVAVWICGRNVGRSAKSERKSDVRSDGLLRNRRRLRYLLLHWRRAWHRVLDRIVRAGKNRTFVNIGGAVGKCRPVNRSLRKAPQSSRRRREENVRT